MKVLVACEESQRVCLAFRKKGHEAYSCDIQECSGGHPEWHIKQDVLPLLNGNCQFITMDGVTHFIVGRWDMIIAHPPCTYLTTAATSCHSLKRYDISYIINRTFNRIDAMTFFMQIINADCDKICVENPQGVMSACFRRPDQVLHPYYFASSVDDKDNYHSKKTGLWLKGLSSLSYSCYLPSPLSIAERFSNGKRKSFTETHHGSKIRSKTFPGIASAMADQWG